MAEHVCPVWVGHLLASPVRKLFQNPRKILGPYVREGMTVLDVGCAMGFFSLPLAQMVGETGRVVCVDVQQPMLDALRRRARKAGYVDRIDPHLCSPDSLGLDHMNGTVDFTLASAVVHETPDPARFFSEIHALLKPGGRLLVSEPRAHVSQRAFRDTLACARQHGFTLAHESRVWSARAALLER